MLAADRSILILAGVDFSQVDLSPIYLRVGLALAVLHLAALASIPARLPSRRWRRAWLSSLIALLALGWLDVAGAFVRPELTRGCDFLNIFCVIGGLLAAPLITLVASFTIWIVRRRRPNAR